MALINRCNKIKYWMCFFMCGKPILKLQVQEKYENASEINLCFYTVFRERTFLKNIYSYAGP